MARPLPPDVIERLRDRWHSRPDLSVARIAAQIGVSPNSVWSAAHRLGWRSRRSMREPIEPAVDRMRVAYERNDAGMSRVDWMRYLWEEHREFSAARIGRILGCSANSVIGHADRRGWEPRGAPRLVPATTLETRLAALEAALP